MAITPMFWWLQGRRTIFLGHFKKSHALLARAVELNPNGAMTCTMCGVLKAINGRPDDGIALIERALRLSPRDPQTYLLHSWLGVCHFLLADLTTPSNGASGRRRLNLAISNHG
jgi:hypothetical protein